MWLKLGAFGCQERIAPQVENGIVAGEDLREVDFEDSVAGLPPRILGKIGRHEAPRAVFLSPELDLQAAREQRRRYALPNFFVASPVRPIGDELPALRHERAERHDFEQRGRSVVHEMRPRAALRSPSNHVSHTPSHRFVLGPGEWFAKSHSTRRLSLRASCAASRRSSRAAAGAASRGRRWPGHQPLRPRGPLRVPSESRSRALRPAA